MPAICTNRLTIWGDDPETLDKICGASAPPRSTWLEKLAGKVGIRSVAPADTGLFHYLNPMPANVEELDIEVLPQLPNEPKSYFWRLKNWGCRHDIRYDFQRVSDAEIRVEFPTDFSPPVAALQQGA